MKAGTGLSRRDMLRLAAAGGTSAVFGPLPASELAQITVSAAPAVASRNGGLFSTPSLALRSGRFGTAY